MSLIEFLVILVGGLNALAAPSGSQNLAQDPGGIFGFDRFAEGKELHGVNDDHARSLFRLGLGRRWRLGDSWDGLRSSGN